MRFDPLIIKNRLRSSQSGTNKTVVGTRLSSTIDKFTRHGYRHGYRHDYGRLSRHDGMQLVRLHDGKFPWTCLGKPIEKILAPLDLSIDEFVRICDQFTNKALFVCNQDGSLKKDDGGNLTKTNYDNE